VKRREKELAVAKNSRAKWLVVGGTPEKELEADRILQSVASEPPFTM
jgi:hypothetical protein